MPGLAKVRKPYYLNFNKEATFGVDPVTGQTALSGEIQDVPALDPKNNPIKTPKHSQLGAAHKVSKGAFQGTLNFGETVQDWRPLARLLGNTIDMIRIIKGLVIGATGTLLTGDNVSGDDGSEGYIEQITIPIDSVTGTIVDGETVTWNAAAQNATVVRFTTSTVTLSGMNGAIEDDDVLAFNGGAAATANLANVQTVDIIIKQFTKDEALTFVGSSETATGLTKIEGINATVAGSSGSIVATDIMTGDSSSARAGIETVTSQTALILTPFNLTEQITVNTGTMTFTDASQSSLIYQHQLAASANQNSYTINYALPSLSKQHLMSGNVMKQLSLDSVVNDAPKFAEDWLLGDHDPDDTIDAEVVNSLDLYEYTDLTSLSINSSDSDLTDSWVDVLKTVNSTFNRNNKVPIDSHGSLNPKGFKGALIETTLKFEIHRQDITIWNLNINDTRFPVVLTFDRGVSGEDDAIVTYPTCKAHQIGEAGSETILLDVPIEIEGTPTAVINDTIADYSA